MRSNVAEWIVGVAGAGSMGSGIAQVAASRGHKVFLFDTNTQALDTARRKLENELKKLVEKDKITQEIAKGILKKISFISSRKDFSTCDIIIEAIVEDLAIKKSFFKELESHVHANCILASNTSSLSIISIGSDCKDPGRVVGLHFFNPATLMPLVEVIPSFLTRSEILTIGKQLMDSWGKESVIAKDTPGFIVNRIARPFYGEAIRIYEEGIADFATIDWAMKTIGGFKMGPFELMDFIGNDINYTVTETVFQQMFYDSRYKPSITQKRLFEGKLFGRKTGRGYYDYSGSGSMPVAEENMEIGKMIFERILCMLINEAIEALYLNIASRDDIDKAMTKGVNYPKGLLKWADETGIEKVYNQVKLLYDSYLEDRYRPSVLLKKMSGKKEFFY